MALKIVTGGTTGAADGTLVSEENRIVFSSSTPVNAHMRCDDGYWSADQDFDLPAQIEVSFDGESTWYGNADEPITAPEIYAVNYPIKLRQPEAFVGTLDTEFLTDGSYTAIAALSTPTLTVTPGDTQNALSWTNVANEDASPGYTVEWSANGSTGWTALTTTAQNVTTYTDTGLTNGVARYYRVRAEGSGRYSDSGWGTGNGTPFSAIFASDNFATGSGDVVGTTPDVGGNWTDGSAGTATPVYASNRIRQKNAGDPTNYTYVATDPGTPNYYVQADITPQSGGCDGIGGVCGRKTAGSGSGANFTCYWADYYDTVSTGTRTWRLYKVVSGSYTSLGSYTENIGTATKTLKLEMNGTAIKVYVDGVQRISVTDSSITANGRAGVVLGAAAAPASNCVYVDNFVAATL